MHNLALELHHMGHHVTGSDDEIYEPSRSRLEQHGLLPHTLGWDEKRITPDLDLILLGMHARGDNPELRRAEELGLAIQSFPEFIGAHASDKMQIVVAGSHGKTTTTAMLMHVFRHVGVKFDYLVGAQLEGFDRMVGLSDAPIMVIEGDEYLSSPLDRRPKFVHYSPDHLILTGIEWDHMNVFPTMQDYVAVFRELVQSLPAQSTLYWDSTDDTLSSHMKDWRIICKCLGYRPMLHVIEEGKLLITPDRCAIPVIGAHNMKNMAAMWHVLRGLSIAHEDILDAMKTFTGAAKRQDFLCRTDRLVICRDFAHAPSKVRATTSALHTLYPHRPLIAVVELHTFSSLDPIFLPQYRGSIQVADYRIVLYSRHAVEMKKRPLMEDDQIRSGFDDPELIICHDADELNDVLNSLPALRQPVYLFMSSGTFDGWDMYTWASLSINQ